jgi:hypothetical protein
MAMIHVNRGATSLGVFSEEEVREGLRTGRFAPTDIGWREGMANWQPLSQFPELASAAVPTVPPVQSGAAATPPPVPPRSDFPWERREELGFVTGFLQTVGMVLTRPTEAFTIMRTEGGFCDPLFFGVIGGSIGAIVWLLISALVQSLGVFAAMSTQQNILQHLMGAGVSGGVLMIRLVLTPIAIAVGLFIWAALVHVCLMLLGGANKSFETSFRALSYAYGATSLFVIIPCCGGLIALVWGLFADCIGISRSHETDIGRAVIAVLLPLVVCCGGIFLLCVMLGVGIGVLTQHSGQ